MISLKTFHIPIHSRDHKDLQSYMSKKAHPTPEILMQELIPELISEQAA
jgi:hypothetical protein